MRALKPVEEPSGEAEAVSHFGIREEWHGRWTAWVLASAEIAYVRVFPARRRATRRNNGAPPLRMAWHPRTGQDS